MSSAHLTENEIDRYRRKVMAAKELFAANEHVSVCDNCYQRYTEGEDFETGYNFIRSEMREAEQEVADHLRYEEMVAYVNGELNEADGDISRTHLEECAQCDSDVADLRLFKSTIGGADPPKLAGRGLFGWQGFLESRPFQVFLAAAASVLVVLGVVWFATATLRSRVDDLEAELAQIRSNDVLSEQLAKGLEPRESQVGTSSVAVSPSSRTVVLNDGAAKVTFDGESALAGLEGIPHEYAELVKSALRTGRLSIPVALFKGAGGGAIRSVGSRAEEPFHLIGPAKITVASNRPTFRWTPMKGAERYVVFVRINGSDEQIESGPVVSTQWTPDKPLASGRVYSWVVEALKDGNRYYVPSDESPSVLFKVLETRKVRELEQARNASRNSHLVMSLLYAREGLIAEARRELKALKSKNPESSQVQALLDSLQRERR